MRCSAEAEGKRSAVSDWKPKVLWEQVGGRTEKGPKGLTGEFLRGRARPRREGVTGSSMDKGNNYRTLKPAESSAGY